MPSFVGKMIENQQYVEALAIKELSLPAATGGNTPLKYSLTDLSAGLRLKSTQLAGT